MVKDMAAIEKKLTSLQIGHFILRVTDFIDNLLYQIKDIRIGKFYLPIGNLSFITSKYNININLFIGDGKIAPIWAKDVADLITLLSRQQNGKTTQKIIELTGGYTVTGEEIRQIMGHCLQRKVEYVNMKSEDWQLKMREYGMDYFKAENLTELYSDIRFIGSHMVNRQFELLTGRNPSSIQCFMHTHLSYLTAQ